MCVKSKNNAEKIWKIFGKTLLLQCTIKVVHRYTINFKRLHYDRSKEHQF